MLLLNFIKKCVHKTDQSKLLIGNFQLCIKKNMDFSTLSVTGETTYIFTFITSIVSFGDAMRNQTSSKNMYKDQKFM